MTSSPADSSPPKDRPKHFRTQRKTDWDNPHPIYVVWEITLACDLGCKHCGSRAGKRRPDELNTQQCLDVVHQLNELGVREVSLIGGEAYLREDWDIIAAEITKLGMGAGITTGARNLTQERVDRAEAAGINTISISVDGLEKIHDRQRGVKGAWRSAMAAAERVGKSSIRLANNSQVNRLSLPEFPALATKLADVGCEAWQVQLTVPMGNAADRPQLLLQPYELLSLYPLLAQIKRQRLKPHGVELYAGNNIGYFGIYESTLRYAGERGVHWGGCPAGQWGLGLEADGKIKACPSLPSAKYTGGYIQEKKIADVVAHAEEVNFIKERTTEDLWGFCGGCYYADICKAGCTWTSEVFFGKPGNNPYCIHRATEQQQKGIQERISLKEVAPGLPFDQGLYQINEEPFDDSRSISQLSGHDLEKCLELTPDTPSIWTDAEIDELLAPVVKRKRLKVISSPSAQSVGA